MHLSRLSVLSLRLPKQIEELKGLPLFSELIILNLNGSQGLRHLPDLRGLPKLKWICVHGCCNLEAPCFGPELQQIKVSDFLPRNETNYHAHHEICLYLSVSDMKEISILRMSSLYAWSCSRIDCVFRFMFNGNEVCLKSTVRNLTGIRSLL